MAASQRTCSKGHRYYKSSTCPVCPICEKTNKPQDSFLSEVAAPARRALEGAGITKLTQLAQLTEEGLLQLHGMGPGSLPKLRVALKANGLTFRKK